MVNRRISKYECSARDAVSEGTGRAKSFSKADSLSRERGRQSYRAVSEAVGVVRPVHFVGHESASLEVDRLGIESCRDQTERHDPRCRLRRRTNDEQTRGDGELGKSLWNRLLG